MTWTTYLFVAGIAGVAAASAALWRWHRRTAESAEEMRYRRCSGCGQKLRFPASKAGRYGRCPRCGRDQLLIAGVVTEPPSAVRVGRPRRTSRPAASLSPRP
jgi:DNA-directed RNA polymerase subunit RPC12/RpoP